jgi:hypothetical protein
MLWSGKLDGEGWREEDTVFEKEKRREGERSGKGGKRESSRVFLCACVCMCVFVCVCVYRGPWFYLFSGL